jgi:hypothetical protein
VGQTAADTAREVEALRVETERLLDALEGRARRTLDVRQQVQQFAQANPVLAPLLPIGAAVLAVGVVLAIWYRNYKRAQEARRPINRLRRGAEHLGEEARARAGRVGRAVRGEPDDAEQAKQQEASMVQRVAGAVAASATLALVDQFTRWLAKRQAGAARQATQE